VGGRVSVSLALLLGVVGLWLARWARRGGSVRRALLIQSTGGPMAMATGRKLTATGPLPASAVPFHPFQLGVAFRSAQSHLSALDTIRGREFRDTSTLMLPPRRHRG
jgi:hypothetical protein